MTKGSYPYDPDYAVAPGETIRETMEHLGMSQVEVAQRAGLSTKHVNELVKGKASITADTALRLERVLGVPAGLWMNLERQYQEQLLRLRERQALAQEVAAAERFPYAALAKAGVVERVTKMEAKARELLRFFAVNSLADLDGLYAAAFRVSCAKQPSPEALMAWLRIGELRAQSLETAEFSDPLLRSSLKDIRALTVLDPPEAGRELSRLLSACGVRLAFVPHLDKTYAHGATRWLGGRPLIQLSVRGKFEDILWFSLFHEIGHIVRGHSRRAILIAWEGANGGDDLEQDANQFAANTLIAPLDHQRFVQRRDLSQAGVTAFAASIGVCPGIVVGRLQHDGVLPRTHLNGLRRKLQIVSTPE